MMTSGEQPPEPSAPQPAGESVRLEARAFGAARINQAARDLHLHYQDGVHGARRVETGTQAQECPYPGLASFGFKQARWFFGRDQLTAELIARLDGRLGAGGVQVVVAPSGAGKSSLLQAGLLPKLGDGALPGSGRWPTVVFTPTAQPLQALATQIAVLTGADPVSVAEQLMADSQRAGPVPRDRIRGGDSSARLVLVVDQFEELFTLCTDDRQRRTFIELLVRIADPQSAAGPDPHPVGLVLIGVRADFYAACVNYPPLRTALQDNPLVVGPMSDTELRAAIRYPAQEAGLDVEPGLVELLLRDLGDTTAATDESRTAGYEAGRLPLLAHTLRATWQQRHGHTLTVEGYRNTGGIHRAVATTADRVFAGLDPASQDAARTLFLRLIKIGDGTEDTRRRMARRSLLWGLDPGSALPALDTFTRGRLLTQEQDSVEITHEALLRAWPRLRQWIDTDRAGNLIRQELEEAADIWIRDRHDTGGLYRGSRLTAARTWATWNAAEGTLSPAASAFLLESTRQEHRAARIRRSVLVVLTVLALLTSVAAVVALRESASAQRQSDTAIFNRVVSEADRLQTIDVSLAAQLDLVAYRMRPTSDLRTNLATVGNTILSTPLAGHTSSISAVAFSPDGQTLATGSTDQTVRLWDMADPAHPVQLGEPLTGHADTVTAVVFSLDGRTLASGSADRTVRLWDVNDPAQPRSLGQALTTHTEGVIGVAFSPDGRTLASGSADQTVRLWDVSNPAHFGPLGEPLTGHVNWVTGVVFSPDGRTLASSSLDWTVRLWDVSNPARPRPLGNPLIGHVNWVYDVTFSPDGRTLASGGLDRTVQLWDVSNPAHPRSLSPPLTGHTSTVSAVAFSPDGRTLATGSTDQTVRLWDMADPAHPVPLGQPLTGHTHAVTAVAFSPDGRTLASGSADQTVRLWDIPHEHVLMTSHAGAVSAVAFSPDGHTLASGSADRTVRLWDMGDPTHPVPLGQPLTGHTEGVAAVTFSPDGRTLATAGADRTVRLWDVGDPAHPVPLGEPLTSHTNWIHAVAFSPDGRTLAAGGADRTVQLWDMGDPTHPVPLDQPLTDYPSAVFAVAFSPDGRILAASGFDWTVRLWDVDDPAHPVPLGEPLTGHTNSVYAVAFSPDGRILAAGGDDQTVWLWDMSDPTHPVPLGQPLTGHTEGVFAVAFSPDGRTLVTGGLDWTVRLWNMADPAHPVPLGDPMIGHADYVTAVAFSPDGHTLASGGRDQAVRLWGMDVDQAIQRICATTRNTLTPERWKQHVSPDLPYDPPCP